MKSTLYKEPWLYGLPKSNTINWKIKPHQAMESNYCKSFLKTLRQTHCALFMFLDIHWQFSGKIFQWTSLESATLLGENNILSSNLSYWCEHSHLQTDLQELRLSYHKTLGEQKKKKVCAACLKIRHQMRSCSWIKLHRGVLLSESLNININRKELMGELHKDSWYFSY